MKLLTRSEELLLLAIWKLQESAYAPSISEHLREATGKEWAFGALFVSLERLVEKGLLESYLSDPTPERGGKSKRIYKLTKSGVQELVEIKKLHNSMWEDIDDLSMEGLS